MIIKNRTLVLRDDLGKIADYIDPDRLKADAEAVICGDAGRDAKCLIGG